MILAEKKRIDWKAAKETLRTAQEALQCSTTNSARMREALRQRALLLAAPDSRLQPKVDAAPVFVFQLGAERYGIELAHVAQVFPWRPVTAVPGSPAALLGIANLHGEVRSVFDLRRLLAMPGGDEHAERYILLLRWEDRNVGLQVEQVEDVRRLPLAQLAPPSGETVDGHSDFIRGVTGDKIIVLRTEVLMRAFFAESSGTCHSEGSAAETESLTS